MCVLCALNFLFGTWFNAGGLESWILLIDPVAYAFPSYFEYDDH